MKLIMPKIMVAKLVKEIRLMRKHKMIMVEEANRKMINPTAIKQTKHR